MSILYWPLSYCVTAMRLWITAFGIFEVQRRAARWPKFVLCAGGAAVFGAGLFAALLTPVVADILVLLVPVVCLVGMCCFAESWHGMLITGMSYLGLAFIESLTMPLVYGTSMQILDTWKGRLGESLVLEVLNLAVLWLAYLAVRFVRRRRKARLGKDDARGIALADTMLPGYIAVLIVGLLAVSAFVIPMQGEASLGSGKGVRTLVALAISGVVFVGACVYSIVSSAQKQRLQREKEVYHKLYTQQEEYYKKLLEKDETLRGFRHDIDSHLSCLRIMLAEGNTQEARNYLDGIEDILYTTRPTVVTGNRVLDIVTAQELQGSPDVQLKWEGMVSGELEIADVDLCILFSNLLKNAIRATSVSEQERAISVQARTVGCNMVLRMDNPSDAPPQFKRGRPVTTKADSRNHGFGLANTEAVARKYGGKVDYHYEGGRFRVDLILPGVLGYGVVS